MALLKSLPAFLLLVAAQAGAIYGSACPNDWSELNQSDKTYCCYGDTIISNNEGYCCVHNQDNGFSRRGATSGNPGDDKRDVANSTSSCIVTVPLTASDYSARVSAASKSIAAGNTPSGNAASPTGDSGATASPGSEGASSSALTPSKSAGAAMVTGAVHVGGVVAAALLVL